MAVHCCPVDRSIQIPILFTGVGYVELEAHPFLKVNGFQRIELCRHHPIQSLGKAGRQSPSLSQERLLSHPNGSGHTHYGQALCLIYPFGLPFPDARQALQELPQRLP